MYSHSITIPIPYRHPLYEDALRYWHQGLISTDDLFYVLYRFGLQPHKRGV